MTIFCSKLPHPYYWQVCQILVKRLYDGQYKINYPVSSLNEFKSSHHKYNCRTMSSSLKSQRPVSLNPYISHFSISTQSLITCTAPFAYKIINIHSFRLMFEASGSVGRLLLVISHDRLRTSLSMLQNLSPFVDFEWGCVRVRLCTYVPMNWQWSVQLPLKPTHTLLVAHCILQCIETFI